MVVFNKLISSLDHESRRPQHPRYAAEVRRIKALVSAARIATHPYLVEDQWQVIWWWGRKPQW